MTDTEIVGLILIIFGLVMFFLQTVYLILMKRNFKNKPKPSKDVKVLNTNNTKNNQKKNEKN